MNVESLVVDEDFGEKSVVLVESEVLSKVRDAGFKDAGQDRGVVLAPSDFGHRGVEECLHGRGIEAGTGHVELFNQVIVEDIILSEGKWFFVRMLLGELGSEYKIEHESSSKSKN